MNAQRPPPETTMYGNLTSSQKVFKPGTNATVSKAINLHPNKGSRFPAERRHQHYRKSALRQFFYI